MIQNLGTCSVLVRAPGDRKGNLPRRFYDIADVAIVGDRVSISYRSLNWQPNGTFKINFASDSVSLADVVEITRLSDAA